MIGAEIALGTAQFGMPYGIANKTGVIKQKEAKAILDLAWEAGVKVLDTAPSYGKIEEDLLRLMGNKEFSVVSKIPLIPSSYNRRQKLDFLNDSISKSYNRLGERLSALLFHDPSIFCLPTCENVWSEAKNIAYKLNKNIKLGVSGYCPKEIAELRKSYCIEVVQLPGNALDQRVKEYEILEQLFMRSIFLQGLLLMPLCEIKGKLPKAYSYAKAWLDWCAEFGCSPIEGAIRIAKGFKDVNYCLFGIADKSQLLEILRQWNCGTPIVADQIKCKDLGVIDPRAWHV